MKGRGSGWVEGNGRVAGNGWVARKGKGAGEECGESGGKRTVLGRGSVGAFGGVGKKVRVWGRFWGARECVEERSGKRRGCGGEGPIRLIHEETPLFSSAKTLFLLEVEIILG